MHIPLKSRAEFGSEFEESWCGLCRPLSYALASGDESRRQDSCRIYEVYGTNISIGNHERFPKHPDGSRDIVKDWTHLQTWKAMEKLLDTGKVKAIGVCNYSVQFLEELLPHATVIPAVNQIENHPSLPQQEIVDFCKTKGIHVTAYSPLGSTGGPLMTNETIVKIAKKHNVSPSTVLLSWHSKCRFMF